jgi:hypothetical protein
MPTKGLAGARSDSRMVLEAVKRDKTFNWVGSRSSLPDILRQMEDYGWTVSVREETPTVHV